MWWLFKKKYKDYDKIGYMSKQREPYSLSKLQRIFTYLISRMVEHAYREGFELTYGEAYRTKEQAEIHARAGRGIVNSLHRDRLAVDFNLYKRGKYTGNSKHYRSLGKYWESLSVPGIECNWGGRFNDGGHFSIGYKGRK